MEHQIQFRVLDNEKKKYVYLICSRTIHTKVEKVTYFVCVIEARILTTKIEKNNI